jgi:Rad3-related DNA helicase
MARFRTSANQEPTPESPALLFRDLRKDASIKFLWGHQEKLLDQYKASHLDTPNLAIELPTGSGKTLVGLLIGEYRRRVRGERVLFLCPNRQLCAQVEAQARKYGVPVSLLVGKQKDYDPAAFARYQEAKAIAISTYSGLFNTNPRIDDPELIICDDAHAADSFVGSLWTLKVSRRDHTKVYEALYTSLKDAIPEWLHHTIENYEGNPADKSGVDLISPIAAADYFDAMKEAVGSVVGETDLKYSWGMIHDNLEACQFYVTSDAFEIRPVVPPTLTHQPFARAKQRVYMSATLGENGDIERSFGVKNIARIPLPEGWDKRGTGRRLILFPNKSKAAPLDVLHGVMALTERSLVLVPNDFSRAKAEQYLPAGFSVLGPRDIENDLKVFTQSSKAVLLLANRYDGIDLPGTDCRMLVVIGVPTGIGLQERYLTERLNANAQFQDRIRTRLTQAVGRCTRDESDFTQSFSPRSSSAWTIRRIAPPTTLWTCAMSS